jgi:hypothetical protein
MDVTQRSPSASESARPREDTAIGTALRQLHDAGRLYEQYLALTRLNEYPVVEEASSEFVIQTPATQRPVGLVVDPSTSWSHPMGLQISPTR